MYKTSLITIITLSLFSCGEKKTEYDASGTFEAVETIVSAEANGTIKQLSIEEGQALTAGVNVGYIDSLQLHLRRKQLQAQIKALLSKMPDVQAQLAALQEQLKQAEKEQKRIGSLVKAEAGSQKQLDDVNAQVNVLKKQIEAQQSSLGITSTGLSEETSPLKVQIEQINDQILKCRITNPVKGTVLTKYAETNEMAMVGKPLYKIADLSSVILRAYITGDQFSKAKVGEPVKVLVDAADGKYKEYEGKLEWISDKAEFTPKTIQTKDERANLVYAAKIKVKNDGTLKIGMYGEVKF
jgi:HlyD family secretion protein